MDWAVLLISEPIKSDGDATKNIADGRGVVGKGRGPPETQSRRH